MISRTILTLVLTACGLSALPAVAQEVEQPAEPDRVPLTAKAVVVQGRVYQAPVGVQATDTDAWTHVNEGDELAAGTQIRVSIRSTLMLHYGDDTVIQLKSMTLASLDDLWRTENRKHSKIGLAYGAMRGSVREKELRTDMIIESPTLTASKEGTEDFGIRAMRGSRWWRAEGPRVGTIVVRDMGTGQMTRLSFSQLANYFNIGLPAVGRNLIDQLVNLYDPEYKSSGEETADYYTNTGVAVVGPGLGYEAWNVAQGDPGRGALSPFDTSPLGLLAEQDLSVLFRQVESRFGTGPFPRSSGAQRAILRNTQRHR
ncbi:MAG: hypothetical protein JSU68_06345 [Phycisphaerales bacterium]|nr:MAG: hypothetical protein JSU68_06345 [Phycisphaerales bacterium]